MADRKSLELIEKIVSFDTTSRESNLELIAFIQEYLTRLDIDSELIKDESQTKANLGENNMP